MVGHKSRKEIRPTLAEKENLPPKKAKRVVFISGLFETKHDVMGQSTRAVRYGFAPKPAGVQKTTAPKLRSSAGLNRSKKAENHPLLRDFASQ